MKEKGYVGEALKKKVTNRIEGQDYVAIETGCQPRMKTIRDIMKIVRRMRRKFCLVVSVGIPIGENILLERTYRRDEFKLSDLKKEWLDCEPRHITIDPERKPTAFFIVL